MWDTTHTHTLTGCPVFGRNQTARIVLSLPSVSATCGFHFQVFFFEGCCVLGFPGIRCSGEPPPAAVCAHTQSSAPSLPSSNTTSLICKCPPRLHTCSLNNPPDHVTADHLTCLVYFRNIYLSSFSANSPLCFPVTGTRIIYDRKFLLDCRNSPLARTPPCCLPQIPGVTVPATHPVGKLQDLKEEAEEEEKETAGNAPLRARFSAGLTSWWSREREKSSRDGACTVDPRTCPRSTVSTAFAAALMAGWTEAPLVLAEALNPALFLLFQTRASLRWTSELLCYLLWRVETPPRSFATRIHFT